MKFLINFNSNYFNRETDGEWFKRIQWKLKRPPPPPENMREKGTEDDAKGSESDFKVVEPDEENYE
jgi:hypothetical protein